VEIGPAGPGPITRGRIAAAAVVLLLLCGGAAYWFIGWRHASRQAVMARVEIAIPQGHARPPAAALPAAAAPTPPAHHDGTMAQPLLPAPDPALVETGPNGQLPIVGRDGRMPWRAYARPFDRSDTRPRVAVIIAGLGPAGAATQSAIDSLPGAVTLAFDPYARRLGEWVDAARGAGHEVILSVPMEPTDFPRQDPGPYTLLTSLAGKENVERLDWVLSRATGYVGIANMMGSRFTTSQSSLVPVFDELKKRGLLFVDTRASEQSVAGSLANSLGVPRVVGDVTLDAEAAREAIDQRLSQLEDKARRSGAALATGFAYPVTLERVALWAKTLGDKGIALAPASALVTAPPTPAAANSNGAAR